MTLEYRYYYHARLYAARIVYRGMVWHVTADCRRDRTRKVRLAMADLLGVNL